VIEWLIGQITRYDTWMDKRSVSSLGQTRIAPGGLQEVKGHEHVPAQQRPVQLLEGVGQCCWLLGVYTGERLW
jgi:hypothetical protein